MKIILKKNLFKKLSIGVASLALVAPLALGSTCPQAHAKHTNHVSADYVSPSRYTVRKASKMSFSQLKRSIRYNKRQLRKYGKKINHHTRYLNNMLLAENDRLQKLNKLYSNHSEKPSKSTRTQKYEAKELEGITKQANSLKDKLNRYGKKHRSRKSRNNIRTIKKELTNLSKKATTLEITSLPKNA